MKTHNMKTIVIGDTHGCYNELKSLIATLEKNKEYNKKRDRLIFLGDYIDRGRDSRKVIGFIKQLQKHNKNVIALMGNHEDMLLKYLNRVDECWTWNGCEATIESYKGYEKHFRNDVEWMRNLPLYYEDEHCIYVHAGIDIDKSMEEQDKHTLLWVREPFIYNSGKCNKQVIFGHTPTLMLGGEDKPVRTYNGNLAIDTGCVYNGALTALILDNGKIDKFYQQKKIKENYNETKQNKRSKYNKRNKKNKKVNV